VGRKDADRLAGLDQQGFVVLEFAQGTQDRVEAFPVARGAADAAVDHQFGGIFRHFRIEVVLQHAEGGFGQPALAAQRVAARCADDTRGIDAGGGVHGRLRVAKRRL
jgi:hypothetical protein